MERRDPNRTDQATIGGDRFKQKPVAGSAEPTADPVRAGPAAALGPNTSGTSPVTPKADCQRREKLVQDLFIRIPRQNKFRECASRTAIKSAIIDQFSRIQGRTKNHIAAAARTRQLVAAPDAQTIQKSTLTNRGSGKSCVSFLREPFEGDSTPVATFTASNNCFADKPPCKENARKSNHLASFMSSEN